MQMSDSGDPGEVVTALESAEDAFRMVGQVDIQYEPGVHGDGEGETQLTKACKLLEVVSVLRRNGDYYTASIEV